MSTLNAYCLGGAGINVGSEWILNSKAKVSERINFIGADTSRNNVPVNDAFKVVTHDKTRGGGSLRSLNADVAPQIIEATLTELKPADFNIIVVGSSGGSGSLLAPFMVRELMKRNAAFVIFTIYDKSTLVYHNNTVNYLRSLEGQRKEFNVPVVLDLVQNKPNMSRGEVNTLAIQRLDLLSLFLTDEHGESDYQDIYHLLNFPKVVNVPSSLVKIEYYDQNTIGSNKEDLPIARFSLFEDRDAVRTIDLGKHCVTGIFSPELPKMASATELHMVLEYSAIPETLIKEMEALEESQSRNKQEFDTSRSVDLSKGADDTGMFY